MLIASAGYCLLALFIWLVEKLRVQRYGADLLTLGMILLFIQVILPGAFLTASLGFSSQDIVTSVPFYTQILSEVGTKEVSLALVLLYLFVFSFYLTWFVISPLANTQRDYLPAIALRFSVRRWLIVMSIGVVSSLILLLLIGGYSNVVLFRTNQEGLNSSFLIGYLFSFSMTFLLLAIPGLMHFWNRKRSIKFLMAFLFVLIFTLMSVSRRAYGIGIILILFTVFLMQRKVKITLGHVVALTLFIPIIIFGKAILRTVASNSDFTVEAIVQGQTDIFLAAVLFFCNIGISTIESWATFLYLDLPMRFGLDHVLSAIRMVPDGAMGLDLGLPERVVRISTAEFVGEEMQDVPPGFIGQMWLDYRFFGPVFWGVMFAGVTLFFQYLYNRFIKDAGVVSLFAVLLFQAYLPMNSGTLDFVFSIHVTLLVLLVLFIIKVKCISYPCVRVNQKLAS